MAEILVSAVLSIHNRAELLRHAMASYRWQTLDPRAFEIVVVDDGSTDDLEAMLRDESRGLNVRLIHMDHTRHPIFRARNPNWQPGQPQDWFHTPALSTNLGAARAFGAMVCLCHPEVIHDERNFWNAVWVQGWEGRGNPAQPAAYRFGRCYLGTPAHRPAMVEIIDRAQRDPAPFDRMLGALEGVDRPPDPGTPEARARHDQTPYHPGYWYWTERELYWYVSLLPRAAIEAVGGVDFAFLGGVAGEDDDFRERVARAGWPSRPAHHAFRGFHQDHSHEPEAHRRRETEAWATGLARNRALLASRRANGFPVRANADYDWTASECFLYETTISEAR